MNINRAGMQGFYKTGAKGSGQAEASVSHRKDSAKHTDVVSISRTGSMSRELGKLTREIAGEVERPDAGRVEAIRAEVRDSSYSVASEKVADAILSRALRA